MGFTAVTRGDAYHPSDADGVAEELWDAIDERRAVLGQAALTHPSAGEYYAFRTGGDALSRNAYGLQLNVGLLATSYLNPGNEANDEYDGESAPIFYANLDEVLTFAGLPNGWRRVTSWDGTGVPTFSYGPIEAGDIDGYWLYEDLQAAITALKWTQWHSQNGGNTDQLYKSYSTASGAGGWGTCAGAEGDVVAGWPAGPFPTNWVTPTASDRHYYIRAELYYNNFFATWNAGHEKWTSKPYMTGIYDQLSCGIDTYYHITTLGTDMNMDGLNLNALNYHETLASAQSATRTGSSYFQPNDAQPYSWAQANRGVGCPNTWSGYVESRQGVNSGLFGVLKWDFTHTV